MATLQYAQEMDKKYPNFSHLFKIPQLNGKNVVYLCGNSLGLMPKQTPVLIQEELQVWETSGVLGHFGSGHKFSRPWVTTDQYCTTEMAKIVGAMESEIAIMNSLTTNLHLLLISFYNPTHEKFRIIIESKAFPSDYYAIASHCKMRGYDPDDTVVQLKPRDGELTLKNEDILQAIRSTPNLALVCLSGVQFYTGQLFNIEEITKVGHDCGAFVGWDLAHAVGNVKLKLHDWNVDFACWCTYKYLNSGPGNIGGAFVHSNHNLPRLQGWWGQDASKKFEMTNEFNTIPGAQGYRLSNPPVLCCASLLGSLQVFSQTSMDNLVEQSKRLTGYLESLILELDQTKVKIITPAAPERGCQLSLLFSIPMQPIFDELQNNGIICDERKPNVIRVSPAPLYNTFEDVFIFYKTLERILNTHHES